ncbi:hypothetical protein GH913_15965 [Xanthomonas citri pv. malvacearum]|nr:hypothetical protein GH913_15965 [Xanthomonas citri pv. malvacearum]
MTLDTYDRVDLTGPWAGFGFQARHMFTPEGRTLHLLARIAAQPRSSKSAVATSHGLSMTRHYRTARHSALMTASSA